MPEREATILINGRELTSQESMTLRVAISSFIMHLKLEGLGDDEHRKEMTALYTKYARTVEGYLVR